jgi:hypothetical protein
MLNSFSCAHHVGLAQSVYGASLKPTVVGSIYGWSNFVKRFCFTVEKFYVVITKNFDENSYHVIRNFEPIWHKYSILYVFQVKEKIYLSSLSHARGARTNAPALRPFVIPGVLPAAHQYACTHAHNYDKAKLYSAAAECTDSSARCVRLRKWANSGTSDAAASKRRASAKERRNFLLPLRGLGRFGLVRGFAHPAP